MMCGGLLMSCSTSRMLSRVKVSSEEAGIQRCCEGTDGLGRSLLDQLSTGVLYTAIFML